MQVAFGSPAVKSPVEKSKPWVPVTSWWGHGEHVRAVTPVGGSVPGVIREGDLLERIGTVTPAVRDGGRDRAGVGLVPRRGPDASPVPADVAERDGQMGNRRADVVAV